MRASYAALKSQHLKKNAKSIDLPVEDDPVILSKFMAECLGSEKEGTMQTHAN